MKEKKSTIFLKILLVLVVMLIVLVFYAYKVIEEDKVNAQNKSDTKVVVKNTPMYHPPLNQRDELEEDENESQIFIDENKTSTIPEGAEYITAEELLEREENISEGVPLEEIYDDGQIIPQDEINNYPVAVTIPIKESEVNVNPFHRVDPPIKTNNSLGRPIGEHKDVKDESYHPSLGTQIGGREISPF
jgi:cytoskeletal protein RodZ